jgi:hypothetical protein
MVETGPFLHVSRIEKHQWFSRGEIKRRISPVMAAFQARGTAGLAAM